MTLTERLVIDLAFVVALFTPLFAGLVLHGFCIRFGWLAGLARPIDGGLKVRGRPLFGANKTWRGVVAVALGASLGYWAQGLVPELQTPALRHLAPLCLAGFGLVLGAASMLGELPNSFAKRQLGIGAGQPGRGPAAPLFYVLDQVDFLLGAWLVAGWWVRPTWTLMLCSVIFVLLAHQLISLIGARLGMRSSAR